MRAGDDPDGALRRRACASTRRARSIWSPKWTSRSSGCSAMLVAERFPDHQVLAEEFGGDAAVPSGPCWVFDPIDGTTNFAHGLPIFCASLALEIDGVAEVAAVYDPNRQRAVHGRARRRRVPERPAAARVGARRRWSTRCWSPGFPTTCTTRSTEIVGLFARVRRTGARGPAARIGGDRSLLRRGGPHGRVLGKRPQAVGHRRRRADRGGSRRPRHEHGRQRRSPRAAGTCSPPTACCTTRCSRVIRGFRNQKKRSSADLQSAVMQV